MAGSTIDSLTRGWRQLLPAGFQAVLWGRCPLTIPRHDPLSPESPSGRHMLTSQTSSSRTTGPLRHPHTVQTLSRARPGKDKASAGVCV